MPFFIPIMLAATALSMIPSFIPHEEKRAREVINQNGNNYFNRQGWRTGNPAGTSRNPYPNPELDARNGKNAVNIQKWILYGGLALVAIIAIKFLVGRR